MKETNSTPRFCSRPLRKLAISPMTCAEVVSYHPRASERDGDGPGSSAHHCSRSSA